MSKIFLDPHKDGCAIWFENGTIKTIKGYTNEVCDKIHRMVCEVYLNKDTKERFKMQNFDIYVDSAGMGIEYYYILKEKYNLKIDKIKRNNINIPDTMRIHKVDNDEFIGRKEPMELVNKIKEHVMRNMEWMHI